MKSEMASILIRVDCATGRMKVLLNIAMFIIADGKRRDRLPIGNRSLAPGPATSVGSTERERSGQNLSQSILISEMKRDLQDGD